MDQNKNQIPLPVSILISGIIIVSAVVYSQKVSSLEVTEKTQEPLVNIVEPAAANPDYFAGKISLATPQLSREAEVLPAEIVLPVSWGNLGKNMVDSGVIDADKFEALYAGKGGLSGEEKELLLGINNGEIRMNQENAGIILNLFWAFGLSNKNEILERGPMMDPAYGGAENFASTGGWTLARGNVMDHYSMHRFINLTPKQQEIVEQVAKNIYRPCCGNSTYFPDCNHGMAMLGLLELMAAQGASPDMMYKIALRVNSYWFPDTYLTIAKYMESKGVSWDKVDPKEMLSATYSSGLGYRKILEQVTPVEQKSGGGCGV